jgi:predicted dehydrogenase
MYMKELVDTGYVGEVMSCHVSMIRSGVLRRTSDRTWQRDDSLGATTLTIPFGHTVDAFRYVVGDFSRVAAVVSTQAPQWLETDTQQLVDVTAPDNVLVSGRLQNGAVASVHVAAIPWASSGFRMEIYGREGTLVASAAESPQLVPVRLQGAKAGEDSLHDLVIPAQYTYVTEHMPKDEPYNVGQMYALFGQAIRSGQPCQPNFDTAVELHRFIDTVRAASHQGRELAVSTA